MVQKQSGKIISIASIAGMIGAIPQLSIGGLAHGDAASHADGVAGPGATAAGFRSGVGAGQERREGDLMLLKPSRGDTSAPAQQRAHAAVERIDVPAVHERAPADLSGPRTAATSA